MKNVIEKIKSFLEKNEWKYQFDEEDNLFVFGLNMENVLGTLKIYLPIKRDNYTVYIILNSKVEEKYYNLAGEFLHRANYGLKNGNFEMDFRDGEVRYKAFVNLKNIDISEEIVEESILVGAAMINRYGKGLLKVMLGEGKPKECIEECEKDDDDRL